MNDRDTKKWQHKIRAANDYFYKWERKFKCKQLEDYLEGFQTPIDSAYEPYVLNLFESTFAVKEPSLLFKKPVYYVDPRPSAINSFPSQAYEWASNATDLLNTLASHSNCRLGNSLEMSIIDAISYFAVNEVQFITNSEPNPAEGFRITEPSADSQEEIPTGEVEDKELVTEEFIRVKRVPAHRFRVGGNDCSELEDADWCGYYDYLKKDDLTTANGFKNVNRVKFAGSHTDEYYSEYNDIENQIELQGDIIKVWKIWDNINKDFFILTDGEAIEIYNEDFDILPIKTLRFKKRRRGWYPVPYAFSWKSPQDEINETREQVRSARRRAKRAWTMREGAMTPDEMDKIVSGPDGTIAIANSDNPLVPVAYPPLDASIGLVLQVSKDDFNNVSGTSAEQRGVSDRTTATQATIIDQRATIRDNREREFVAEWVCSIGLEILRQFKKFSTLPQFVKVAHDPGGFFQDVPDIQETWKQLTSEDLGDIEYQVGITVESLSPVANDQEKRKFMEFVAILSQYPIIASHPELIMEAAFRTGYKNMKVIKAFQQAAMLQMVGQISQANGGQLPGGSGNGVSPNPSDNMAQQTAQQMIPPTQTQIQNQMDAIGVPQ